MSKKSPLEKKTNKYITSLPLLILTLPVLLWLFVFHYLPIFGIVTAFENFNYRDKFASPFVGFENFEYFFKSSDAIRVIGNTIGYFFLFQFTSIILGVIIALLMYEVNSKGALKFFQTTMAMPSNISWVIMAYIVYAFLNYQHGIVNTAITSLGGEAIAWYNSPKFWPIILLIVNEWQTIGMGCLLYYATLMGVDQQLFEAAELDGASRFKQIIHISLPSIKPIIAFQIITGMGGILGGNLGLFYQVPMDSAALYSTTDILPTYLLRGLKSGKMGVTSAVGLFSSVVGCTCLLLSNLIIKKLDEESAIL